MDDATQKLVDEVLALHPDDEEWMEYGIPVFDEFDSSTARRVGCRRCNHYGYTLEGRACSTRRALLAIRAALEAAQRRAEEDHAEANRLVNEYAVKAGNLALALEAAQRPPKHRFAVGEHVTVVTESKWEGASGIVRSLAGNLNYRVQIAGEKLGFAERELRAASEEETNE